MKKCTPSSACASTHEIEKHITPEDRNHWCKLNHKLVSTKKSKSKFKRDESRKLESPKYPFFKTSNEAKNHHSKDFPSMTEIRTLIAKELN